MDQELGISKRNKNNIQHEEGVRHNQELQCDQAALHSDSTLPCKKENETLKQAAYVNYTLNEFKELSQKLEDFKFVDNCKPH